jgi:hypothetical protein
VLNKTEIKYIKSFLHEREEKLEEANEEIERRENMDSHYTKLNTQLFGEKYFKTKTWKTRVESEFTKIIKLDDKLKEMLEDLLT